MRAVNSPITLLLSLQDKDAALASVRTKLLSAPTEIENLNKEIKTAERKLAEAVEAFKALEKKSSDMRKERKTLEEKISKYRGQLLDTKKNDDYIALNKEIDRLVQKVSEMETDELQMMMDIDAARDALDAKKSECTAEVDLLNGKIWKEKKHIGNLEAEFQFIQGESKAAEEKVPPAFLNPYLRIRKSGKKFPIVVSFDGEKCCGCFLKVSPEISERFKDAETPVQCEQCGRIMYIPRPLSPQ